MQEKRKGKVKAKNKRKTRDGILQDLAQNPDLVQNITQKLEVAERSLEGIKQNIQDTYISYQTQILKEIEATKAKEIKKIEEQSIIRGQNEALDTGGTQAAIGIDPQLAAVENASFTAIRHGSEPIRLTDGVSRVQGMSSTMPS